MDWRSIQTTQKHTHTHIYIYYVYIFIYTKIYTQYIKKNWGWLTIAILLLCKHYGEWILLWNCETIEFWDMRHSEGNLFQILRYEVFWRKHSLNDSSMFWIIFRMKIRYSEGYCRFSVGTLVHNSNIFLPIALKNPRVGWKILNRFLSNGSAAVLKQLCVDQFGPAQQVGYHSQPPHECCWVIKVIHADEIRLQIITTNPWIQNSAGSWN